MRLTALTIGGRTFKVPSDLIDTLKLEIIGRVRLGGGFIAVPTPTGIIDVLVTPAIPVTIEPPLQSTAPLPSSFPDFDAYGL